MSRVMHSPIRRYWNSIAFRLTLNYGLLSLLTTLILLLFTYTQVVNVLRTQLSSQISHAHHRLSIMLDSGGVSAVMEAIDLAIADELDGGEDLYLLIDADGHKLAGNISAISAGGMVGTSTSPYVSGLFDMAVDVGGRNVKGHFMRQVFSDGHALVIGYEAGKVDRVNAMTLRGIGLAFLVAGLLVILGSLVFRREFEKRFKPLRATARQVGAGQLSLRIPHSQHADEFSHLSHEVNAMLDRIEQLMNGVRDVSDTIAHDLRTPLMRTLGRLRSAQRPDAPRHELATAIDRSAKEIEQLNALLGKLLHISELEAGVRRKSFTECYPARIAEDVVELYSALAEDKNVHLSFSASDDAAMLYGDAQLLANAFANLLDNALKYANRHVRVTAINNSDSIVFTFEDDGPGIAEDKLARLGERFYRPDATHDGMGLGLASVKAIVRLHGGELSFVNRSSARDNPGRPKGFVACVRLPLLSSAES